MTIKRRHRQGEIRRLEHRNENRHIQSVNSLYCQIFSRRCRNSDWHDSGACVLGGLFSLRMSFCNLDTTSDYLPCGYPGRLSRRSAHRSSGNKRAAASSRSVV
jgi:hypothetical protein